MAEKSLQEYAASIKHYLDEGRVSEALPMAQHLLRQNPRYLPGYELLAEVALQQGSTRDAIELFRRVLSVDPENFPAHTGLAAAYNGEGVIDEALWHMMRAFEIDPGNRDVRQQLRMLFEARDGRAPGRLHLNRAALSRTYLRDGWYDRAIEELQGELQEEPDRVDLSAALVEAQWLSGRHQDAVRSAEALLQELPYCLKANLILGEFYAQEGDLDSAERYLRIVQELDPEHEWAAEYFGEASYLKPNQVPITSLDEALGRKPFGQDGEQEPLPDWLDDLPMFNQGVDDDVNWDAITEYETHWRTVLSRETRRAVESHKPNWRTELRRSTTLALRERPDTTAAAASTQAEPVQTAPAPAAMAPVEEPSHPLLDQTLDEPRAPDLAPVASEVTSPVAESDEMAETGASTAVSPEEVAPEPLQADEQADVPLTVTHGAWRLPLRAATLAAMEEYDDWGMAPLPDAPALAKIDWRQHLTVATTAALNEFAEPVESLVAPTPEVAPSTPYWREWLDSQTRAELEEFETWQEPKPDGMTSEAEQEPSDALSTSPSELPWPETLRAATSTSLEPEASSGEVGVASESLESTPAQSDDPAWVLELREVTEAATAMESAIAGAEPVTAVEPATPEVEGIPIWVTALRLDSVEMLAARAPAETEEPAEESPAPAPMEVPWARALRADTRTMLDGRPAPAAEEDHHGLAERLVDGAAEVAHLVQGVASTLKRKATGALTSLFNRDQEKRPDEAEPAQAPERESGVGEPFDTGSADSGVTVVLDTDRGASDVTDALDTETTDGDITDALDIEMADSGVTVVLDTETPDDEVTNALDAQTVDSDITTTLDTGTMVSDEPSEEVVEGTSLKTGTLSIEEVLEETGPKTGTLSFEELLEPVTAVESEEASLLEDEALTADSKTGSLSAEDEGDLSDQTDDATTPLPDLATVLSESDDSTTPIENEPETETDTEAAPGGYDLALARAAWERGESKEAFAIYQRLFFEEVVDDKALGDALRTWTVTGDAPALAHQLLGDVYRRLNRMPEALAEYREAIRRM